MLYLLKKTLLYIEEQNVWLSQLQSAIVEREQKYLLLHSLIINQINEEIKNERNGIDENNVLCNYIKIENDDDVAMISERRNDVSAVQNYDMGCSNDLGIIQDDGYYDIAEVGNSDNEMADSNENDLNEEEMDNTSSIGSMKDGEDESYNTIDDANVQTSSTDQNLTVAILKKANAGNNNIKITQPKNLVVALKGVKKQYKCPYAHCNITFQQRCYLRYHMRTHTGEKPFGCSDCDQFFARKSTLRKHQMRIHVDEKPFNCEKCDKSYALQSDLADHLRVHRNERSHTCLYCDKSYSQKRSLTEHIRKVHDGGEKLNCKYCDKAFKYHETLKDHLRKHVDTATYKCLYCDEIFYTVLSHKKHVQLHEAPFQCPICSKYFSNNSRFTEHMRTHK